VRDWEQRQTEQLPKLWDIMDRLVVGLLNNQKTTQDIQGVLAQLSGYKPPRFVPKETIGGAVFSNGVDSEYPNYWITQVERDGTPHALGVYNDNLYPYKSLNSRLSVYTRKKTGWIKTDAFQEATTICLYVVPTLEQGKILMTVEQLVGGDHISGYFKFWQLEPEGKLRLLTRIDSLLVLTCIKARNNVSCVDEIDSYKIKRLRARGAAVLDQKWEDRATNEPASPNHSFC
jgi:hypothetical protein